MREHVLAAALAIQKGGVIVYPTEGVYGLGCDPANAAAVSRLLALKHRLPNKGFILIASRFEMLSPFVPELPTDCRDKVLSTWPGPITWVLPARHGTPKLLTGGRDTLAVRVSAHPFVVDLCDELGHALVSTSANISGDEPAADLDELNRIFAHKVEYITPLAPGDLERPTPIFDALSGAQLR